MDEIELAIRSAWSTLAPQLARDPHELHRRLDRASKLRTLAHPPRAWCLAIRASDTRLDANNSRDHGQTRDDGQARDGVAGLSTAARDRFTSSPPHLLTSSSLTLDRATILSLTQPVHLDPPGETLEAVAKKLGTSPHGLLHARLAGVFRTKHLRGLGGRGGKPRPLLYTDQPLDPSARLFTSPDPLWSWTATSLGARLPRDLPPQQLTRVPIYQKRAGRTYDEDVDQLHPEHPTRDVVTKRSLALPPPKPDYVAYKWKDGEYVDHDWRKPHIAAAHAKKQRSLELARTAARRRRAEHPPPSQSKGSLEFRGYRWRCPKCERMVNVLYLPLPPVRLIDSVSVTRASEDRGSRIENSVRELFQSSIFHPPSSLRFACERCTRVRRISRCDPNAWNEIVTYLSGGLLFGSDVKRPSWFPVTRRVSPATKPRSDEATKGKDDCRASLGRKIDYVPRPNRAPSKRRPQIESMLLAGMSFQDIAATLSLSKGTVLWTAQQIYKQHGVTTFKDFVVKLGHPELAEGSRYRTEEIRRRILAGQPVPQIAADLGVPKMMIYNQRQMMRKRGIKLRDGRKSNRVAWRVRV